MPSPARIFVRIIALVFLLAAAGIAYSELPGYRLERTLFPDGETVAGVPVGGLSREQAVQRLAAAYQLPVEMHYQQAVIQASPTQLGFQIDPETMLSAALPALDFTFWDYLWQRRPPSQNIPLQASQDPGKIQDFLQQEIVPRYDPAPVPAMPIPGTVNFSASRPGAALEAAKAVPLLQAALRSLQARSVQLDSQPVPAPRPEIRYVQTMLQQLLTTAGFTGLAEIYLQDLHDGEMLSFATQQGSPIPTDIAFTAASTIKIPVLISVFRRTPEPIPENTLKLVQSMIQASDNPSTDLVVQTVIDPVRGPLEITQDLQALGYKNTYWAGYFYDGAPLLDHFQTPANRRSDADTHPDIYNQTTAADMGSLLAEIYRCAQTGASRLTSTFPGEITQEKCQQMAEILKLNLSPYLIKAGLPDGTPISHKHGWAPSPDGLLHNIADVAYVHSPGGDYIFSVYIYQPTQLVFDPANIMIARLSEAVYNYFNLPSRN